MKPTSNPIAIGIVAGLAAAILMAGAGYISLFSVLLMIAAVAAWTDCDDWHAALLRRLDDQRALLGELLATHLPDARTRPLQASYLAWLDLRAYGHDDPAQAGLAHGVRVSAGQDYQPGLAGHVRVNLATSAARLEQVVERLAAAVSAPPA